MPLMGLSDGGLRGTVCPGVGGVLKVLVAVVLVVVLAVAFVVAVVQVGVPYFPL